MALIKISFQIILRTYTDRQKKLITSSAWHSLKSTASKWFIFGHRLGKFILNKHMYLKKQKCTSIKEEINAMKSQEVNFQKSQKLLASWAGSSKQTIAVRRLRNLPLKLNLLNVRNRPPPWSSLGEQFLRFLKNDLSWFNHIFLLFDARKSCVFQIFLLLRSIKAYLCPNINFDSVDYSERRPWEVISFFWRSVYVWIIIMHSTPKIYIFFDIWKGHSLEVHCTNIRRKRFVKY